MLHLTGRNETRRHVYRERNGMKTAEAWDNEGTVEEMWSVVRLALVVAGEEVLGHAERQATGLV